jgi:hypothetical protein
MTETPSKTTDEPALPAAHGSGRFSPCPFCGNKDPQCITERQRSSYNCWISVVRCHCGATGPSRISAERYTAAQNARRAWNDRSPNERAET